MDWAATKLRFAFLAEALHGTGGFAPQVRWEDERVQTKTQDGTVITAWRRVPKTAGACHLVPHVRESAEKFAGRCAVAVYENHLRQACERFASFLARRRPLRDGADTPLAALLLADADLSGASMDEFIFSLALHLKARGTMFVLMDRAPAMDEGVATLAEQAQRRAVPFLRTLCPEIVDVIELDDYGTTVRRITISSVETIDGRQQAAQRTWDAEKWYVHQGDRIISQGEHGFGECPVLAVTESGSAPPVVGRYAQIADLSRRMYNARSELDDILRSQTFSVLTLQVPQGSTRSPAEIASTIGTHSLLVHEGQTPAFVAPSPGPADTFLSVIQELQSAIRRIASDDSTEKGQQVESGLARRMRFEQLNAELASMALRLQGLERRIWALFHAALGISNTVHVEYPTDFNLVDTLAELDVLAAMQATGFPDTVLALKRKVIAAAEFDAAEDDDKAAALAAIDEDRQAASAAGTNDPQGEA